MRKVLIALSGARTEIIERCPTEIGKFEGIGGAVLTTSVLACVSMTFALVTALGVAVPIAVPAALIWGLMIMSLDRWLVASMTAGAPRRWRLALPRMVMAVFLGFVISTPLVLQVFRPEIDAQLVQIKQRRADAFLASTSQGAVGRDVASLRAQVAALEKVISSHGEVPVDPAADPQVKSLTRERDQQQTLADAYYTEWQCQLYGGASCPKKGDGPLAEASKKSYDKARARIDDLNRQIEARKERLTADDEASKRFRLDQAKQALPRARAELDAALKRQADLQAAFDAENIATNGLLIRLQALNEVSGKDMTLNVTRLLLFLLFLLIECLPVVVKLMQRPGNYERVLALAEQHEFREARSRFSGLQTRSDAVDTSRPMVREIWLRDTPPVTLPAETRADRRPAIENVTSPEDSALRSMTDARDTRSGSGRREQGEFELFPEDEDF